MLFISDPAHVAVLIITFSLPFLLAYWGRKQEKARALIPWILASILLLNKIVVFTYACVQDAVPWSQRLPMQLCDWVTFITAAALIWGQKYRLLKELAYFWGLAGTLQATLTPDLPYSFPHFYFFTFHISHSGIIISVLYLVFGMGLRPTFRSVLRSFLWIQTYGISAGLTNWLLNENYGYLCRKPLNPSLLDYLGEWPWYILSLEVLAFLFFVLYWLPFLIWKHLSQSGIKESG